MKTSIIVGFLLLFSISAQSQEQNDSIDHDLIYPSYFYTGVSTSLNYFIRNINIAVGHNVYFGQHALALEYEIGRVFSTKDEWLNRITFKFYPSIVINQRNSLVFGIGVQKFGFTKSGNGLFSRFDDNYRQEIDYSVYRQFRNVFGVAGLNNLIGDNILLEVLGLVGYGKITGGFIGIPEDAVYIGNGSFFGPTELREVNRDGLTLDIKVSLAYMF